MKIYETRIFVSRSVLECHAVLEKPQKIQQIQMRLTKLQITHPLQSKDLFHKGLDLFEGICKESTSES